MLSRARGGRGKRDETLRFLLGGPGAARTEGDRPPAAPPQARLERVQAQRLHEASAAGAGAQQCHRRPGERVAHGDAQAELFAALAGRLDRYIYSEILLPGTSYT